MAETKQVATIRKENQLRAMQSHAGFVSYVAGKVEKIGLEEVLKSGRDGEYFWLKKQLDRVLDFAEQIQLKMVPQKLEGDFNHLVVMGEIKVDNNPLRFNIGNPNSSQNSGYSSEAYSDN